MDDHERQASSNQALVEEIRQTIARDGPISFARFMDLALYHPSHGYYMTTIERPGREGDFLTAPEAHPIFGHALARQLDQLWDLLDRPERFTLREYGASSGRLALAILAGLQADGSELLPTIRYEPVEINPARREDLRRGFEQAGWADLVSFEPAARFSGCALANEFVDAFPIHRLIVAAGQLHERYVTWQDGWFAEQMGPLANPEIAAYLRSERVSLSEGQQLDVLEGGERWIGEVAASLERGYLLVIDYGYPARELYGAERHGGTFKAYDRHSVNEDPFRAIGHQDLTAHVDFTALERAAERAGLRVVGLTDQASFLAGAGIGELLVELQQQEGMTLERYLAARSAVMRMIDPSAMGRFRVLALAKDAPGDLRGFSLRL